MSGKTGFVVRSLSLFACLALIVPASAQETSNETLGADDTNIDANEEPISDENVIEANPDEIADMLNSQQQLTQGVTLKRSVNGEVVESDKRVITYSRDKPYRRTEAEPSEREKLRAQFDGELLTRTEAFDEARLDFVIADTDQNGLMTADEFAALVNSWREKNIRKVAPRNNAEERQRNYEDFLEEIDPEAAQMQTAAYAHEKFSFMAGAQETISREDYIREYLLDFDSMDQDKDTMLRNDELAKFRAMNRGETVEM